VFGGRYPKRARREDRTPIPPAYATELQTVMNALNDMKQARVEWDCGTTGIGVLVSDSLMFQRGEPTPSDLHLSHVYGLALPLLKRGMPVTPVQLENLNVARYLDGFRVLLLSYHGMKPLSPDVHQPLADWVKRGGVLVVIDDDTDPYNWVREWWNSDGHNFATPREHLFEQLGVTGTKLREGSAVENVGQASSLPVGEASLPRVSGGKMPPQPADKMSPLQTHSKVGRGYVIWMRENPAKLAASADGDARMAGIAKQAVTHAGLKWRETNYLLLRRGPYLIAAGLDESVAGEPKEFRGKFVNLFDLALKVRDAAKLSPGSRFLLLDLTTVHGREPRVLASACKALATKNAADKLSLIVEGVGNTPAVVLMHAPKRPREISLGGEAVKDFEYSPADKLLWIRFPNEATPRELSLRF